MASILDSVKGYLTNELIGAAARQLGESESGILKAAGGMAPAILAGILNKSGDASAMGNIFSQLSDSRNAGFLDNLGGLVGGGNLSHNDPKDIAGRLMGTIFGGKTQALLNSLSSFAGIKSSSASSLMGMVGPLLMGVLGKKISSEGLNLSGLMNLLKGEKSSIMSALPSGLGSVLGFADFDTKVPNIEVPTVKTGGTNWMWPLLLLLGIGVALFAYFKGCSKPAVVEAPKVEMPTVTMPNIDTVAAKTTTAVTNFMKKLASGFELKGNAGGIESGLIGFIESDKVVDKTTWFNFDRLTFKTASADLDMEKSIDQLNNIVEIMKAFPKVKLKIGGYTDSDGDDKANMALSQKRADATKAALVKMGVAAARLEAEGYGEAHPVCPANDTPECKAQNRRIAVRVMEK